MSAADWFRSNPIRFPPVPPSPGFRDFRCATCEHPPEAHHAGSGQCYDCPAERRCVRHVFKDRPPVDYSNTPPPR